MIGKRSNKIMLRRQFNFEQPIDVVMYLRMSSDKQNPNSPAQQRERIEAIIKNRNLPWRVVGIYQDNALSGIYARKRPDFTRMLHDIESGVINVNAILVDTIERFGRMDDLESRRRRLANRHGVVILTADRNFSDPYSPDAKAMSAIENLRAYDANRIKAHDVYRGKLGSIYAGYWPGSPVPFGYRLEVVHVEIRHHREVKHHALVLDDLTGPIMGSFFEKSATKPSWGQDRLTAWLNSRDDIPEHLKPFHASTVGKWLRSPIYRGVLVWSKYSQGVVDDRRILEKNDEQHIIRVEGFCEPIATKEILDQVDANLMLRMKVRPQNDDGAESNPARGVCYKHPLTGLVRCGRCGASMVPNSTAPYTTKSGTKHSYCSYMCPNGRTQACGNRKRIKEEWLRETIIGKIMERLTPDDESVSELVEEARQMVADYRQRSQPDPEASLACLTAELEQLEAQVRGWAETLAKPDLHRRLRDNLVSQTSGAYDRIEKIEQEIEEFAAEENVLEAAVQPIEVSSNLRRLHAVLLGECPTATNLELSMHIDKIERFDDGKVVSRICKIGSAPGAIQWFCHAGDAGDEEPRSSESTGHRVKPRRRALLRLSPENGDFDELLDRIHTATDPNRFAGLPDHWFWIDEYRMPEKTYWVEENAQRVLARYEEIKASGKTPSLNAIAKEFGKSRPTISRALDIATDTGGGTKPEHRREPNPVKGNPELESQIAQMHDAGKLNKEIAEALGLGRSTVTMALDRLYEQRGLPRPDGRRERHR
jgi:DNA invertase Pin-like site-specific DNA recombinase